MSIILFGQYPRSERLVQVTRDFDRKRITEEEVAAILEQDRQQLKILQEGFLYPSSGLFHWEDLMRPLSELIDNCQAGALTRFFETNTFWRLLEIQGDFRIKEDLMEPWIRKYFFPETMYTPNDTLVFTLPFLFLFRSFSTGIGMGDIQSFLHTIVSYIDKTCKGIVVFFEPYIGWEPLSSDQKNAARQFLEKIKSEISIPIALAQCFCCVEGEKNFLFSLPVDMLGIDFYCNRLHVIGDNFPAEKSLLAGVMSTESASPEKSEHILQFIEGTKKFLPEEQIYFSTSGPAELLPREIMDMKLAHLKEAVRC